MNANESAFLLDWRLSAPGIQLDYDLESLRLPYLLSSHDYRADFVHVGAAVAIELQGGTWNSGKHGRGSGIAIDCRKLAFAQLHGWQVFQVPTGETDFYIPIIITCIERRYSNLPTPIIYTFANEPADNDPPCPF